MGIASRLFELRSSVVSVLRSFKLDLAVQLIGLSDTIDTVLLKTKRRKEPAIERRRRATSKAKTRLYIGAFEERRPSGVAGHRSFTWDHGRRPPPDGTGRQTEDRPRGEFRTPGRDKPTQRKRRPLERRSSDQGNTDTRRTRGHGHGHEDTRTRRTLNNEGRLDR